MALKGDRDIIASDIGYFGFTAATRGGVVCAVASGSLPSGILAGFGGAMDSAGQRIEYAATASGKTPIGILATDVVSIDQSRQFLNPFKSEAQVGDKVTVYTKGTVSTNFIVANTLNGVSLPTPAYAASGGNLIAGVGYNTASGYPRVGTFLSYPDTDGYAKVRVDL